MKNKLCILLALMLLLTALPVSAAEVPDSPETMEEIHIHSVQDLLALSENGTGEEYSIGRRFILDQDLDFTGKHFEPIPVFAGTFDGGYHTISGLSYTQDGSDLGLFRFIGERGVIRNLNLIVELMPVGEMDTVGGIAGTNKGRIDNCTVDGIIRARTILGGIAGVNDETGVIYRCRNMSDITGTKNAGGIVGINKGNIVHTTNNGHVNATSETIPTEEMDAEKAIELTDYLQDMSKIENIGGIAGTNDETGIIDRTFNYEVVGYPHMGYGVGGIAGMQKGYIYSCMNNAYVYGRKDIGGVAGAFTPYVFINYEDDAFTLLEKQFDNLSAEVDTLEDYADTLDDELYEGSQEVRRNIDELRDQLREYKDYYREKERLIDLENDYQMDQIEKKIDKIETELKLEALANETDTLTDQIATLIALDLALDGKLDDSHGEQLLSETVASARETLKALGYSGAMLEGAMQQTLAKLGISYDPATKKATVNNDAVFRETVKNALGSDLTSMDKTLDSMMDILKNDAGQFTTLKKRLIDLRDRGKKLREFLDTQQEALRKDVDESDRTISELDDQLSDSISAALDDFDENKAKVREEMHIVRDRMRSVRHTAEDGGHRLRERIRDKELYYDVSDSEENIPEAGRIVECVNQGEIYGDVNGGGIVGRIAIDISNDAGFSITENGDETLNFEQDLRAVLLRCGNYSDIFVKNDYAGGVVGRADYGAVIAGENYGNITAESGKYAGGIAGNSAYRVRNCYCLCNVTSTDYAGGIVGYGKDVYENTAMASAITSKGAKAGTIAGDVDPDGRVESNIYVAETQGAVNNVTYITQAEGIDYYRLISDENTPSDFYRFQVKFVADGITLKSMVFDYGEDVAVKDIPAIPLKEGYYSDWEEVELKDIHRNLTIHAVYSAWETSIASGKKEGDRPYALIGADFYPGSILVAEKFDPDVDMDSYKTLFGYAYHVRYKEKNDWESLELRVLAEDKNADTLAYIDYDGNMTMLETERVESYLKAIVPSSEGKVVVLSSERSKYRYFIIGGIACGILLLFIVLRLFKKHS